MRSSPAGEMNWSDNRLRRAGARPFLSAQDISACQGVTPLKTYPAGTELFRQGCPADRVFFIAHGLIKLSYLSQKGRELIVDLRFPGWALGAVPVLLQRPHPVSGKTLTQCQLATMRAESFRVLLKTDKWFAANIQMMQSLEVYQQMIRISRLACLSAQDHLEQFIGQLISVLELSGSSDEVRIPLPMKQAEIAELIAVTPEHLSVLLKRMEQQGVIRREKGWLIIPDPKRFSSTVGE